jgi:propanediol dehydratase small subunit
MKDTCDGWMDYYVAANKNSSNFKLRRIKSLKDWPVKSVLTEKYKMKEVEATLFSNFLNRML